MSSIPPIGPQTLGVQEINQFIKDERFDEARRALRSLLARDAHNAAGWWLYAKVAPNLTEACTAVKNVLAIDPNFPSAREALAILKRRLAENPPAPPPDRPTARPDRDRIETLIGAALLVVALALISSAAVYAISSQTADEPASAPAVEAGPARPLVAYAFAEW